MLMGHSEPSYLFLFIVFQSLFLFAHIQQHENQVIEINRFDSLDGRPLNLNKQKQRKQAFYCMHAVRPLSQLPQL